MIHRIALTFTWVVLPVLCVLADEPKKPQWQRMLTGDDAKTAQKFKKQIDDLQVADDYAGAIKAGEELLTLRVRVQDQDHHETVTLKQQIVALRKIAEASAKKRLGWQAAKQAAIKAVELREKGHAAEVLSEEQAYLKWCCELLGEDHPDTATSYNNVALNLYNQRKYVEAQPLFEKALDIRCKVLSEEHPDTAMSYHNVAWNLSAQGKYVEAQPLLQKALKICCKVLGDENPDTAKSYNIVGLNLYAQGKYAEAQPLLQKALNIRRKMLGDEHPETVVSYYALANDLYKQSNYAEAQSLYHKALDIRRKVFGEEHPDTLASYNDVALTLQLLGRYYEAQVLLQKSLNTCQKVLGEEHVATGLSYRSLASCLEAQGKHLEANPLFQKALDIDRKAFGDEHTRTANAYYGMARNLRSMGKFVEAQSFFQKALDIQRKLQGDEHSDTARTYHQLASTLHSQSKYPEAQEKFQKALNIRRKLFGDEHIYTAESYNGVAYNLNALGMYTEAQPLFQKALDIRLKVLGEDTLATAQSYNNVAFNLNSQGKFAEALPFYQKALDIYRKVRGDSFGALKAYLNMASNYESQGMHSDAESILESAVHAYELSRAMAAIGLDRASRSGYDPRLNLAALTQGRDPSGAWRLIELSLARSLLDQQATSRSFSLTAHELAEQAKYRERLTALQPQILFLSTKTNKSEEDSAILKTLLKEFSEAEERLAALEVLASQREVADPSAIRKEIPHDSALLFWVDVPSWSGFFREHWVCVVRPSGEPKWERLPGTGPDGKWSQADGELPGLLREALADAAPRSVIEAMSKQLRDQRITPALKHLEGVKNLYAVPVQDMASVPVELLAPEFAVSYVPSGTVLVRAKNRPALTGQRTLALGDPIFTQPGQKQAATKSLPPGGLLITQVIPNSIAAKARLQPGDAILKYGNSELKDIESLTKAIATNEKAASVSVILWRETADKPFVREVVPGNLGVVLATDSAPVAVASRRKTDAMLLSLRGGGWKDLPGTRIETERLRRMLGDQCVVLTDSAASEQGLEILRKSGELSKFRYLHFATHGEGNSVRAFDSALILAQDKLPKEVVPAVGAPTIDGQLTAREVLEYWKLNADLVTLSACETAIGKYGHGEGSLGFAQAFLTAGTRSVCLSLWKVDDTATALLMDRFYQNLLGKRDGLPKPMGKAAALDEAKRWLRNLSGDEALALTAKITNGVARGTRSKDEDLRLVVPSADSKNPPIKDIKPFAHPYYWAAFILIGDPN